MHHTTNNSAWRLMAWGWVLCCSAYAAGGESIDLAGRWSLKLDPQDVGQTQGWFNQPLPEQVRLPASIQEQGFGEKPSTTSPWTGTIFDRRWFTADRYQPYRQPGNIKLPFWLTPQRVYVGPAWFSRQVTIPRCWAGKRITLYLERPHWTTTCWVDGRKAGFGDSLITPHVHDLTAVLGPGEHRLTLRVDNRMYLNVGPNAHSISDHTQGNWNGIVGKIELRATAPVWVEHVRVTPDVPHKQARLVIALGNITGQKARGTLRVAARCGEHRPAPIAQDVAIDPGGTTIELAYPLGRDARPWDEFHPNVYDLAVSVQTQAGRDTTRTRFGLRKIEAAGKRLRLNGKPLFLRGSLECCIFPRTGYPPTTVGQWKRVIGVAKSCGLNHFRFHSWCPPEAAFTAADELGFYYHVEGPFWANQGVTIGDGKPIDQFIYTETDRILRAYGNHPSFVMMAYGNEPAGRHQRAFLSGYVKHYKARDPRRLWTSAAGWPFLPENDYDVMPRPLRLYKRLEQQPLQTTFDYDEVVAKMDKPLISHEPGQWCVFPNLVEIDKYTGNLQARNFEIVRDLLEQKGLSAQAHDFLIASGKFQALLYKQEIESFLRTAGLGGFQLLQLHDFPGQGSALIGMLDPFFDPKGYISYEQIRRFSGPVVPLARMSKRVWLADQSLDVRVQVSQFGAQDLPHRTVTCTLSDRHGKHVARQWSDVDLPAGSLCEVGSTSFKLDAFAAPAQLKLTVRIEGTEAQNAWDLWVYPAKVDTEPPHGVLIADSLNEKTRAYLKAGGSVLLAPGPKAIAGNTYGYFRSIFWNKLWFTRQQCHTLGILCDPAHPALAAFPTETHSNWQWWDPATHSKPMVMDDLPRDFFPIIQVIDDWNTCRKLGLVFEAKVAGGKLILCSIDLFDHLKERPVTRQLRRSLLNYMAGPHFDPGGELTIEQVQSLLN